jgi:hypothetical protein
MKVDRFNKPRTKLVRGISFLKKVVEVDKVRCNNERINYQTHDPLIEFHLSSSILAATIKSFSERPSIACVVSSTPSVPYPTDISG